MDTGLKISIISTTNTTTLLPFNYVCRFQIFISILLCFIKFVSFFVQQSIIIIDCRFDIILKQFFSWFDFFFRLLAIAQIQVQINRKINKFIKKNISNGNTPKRVNNIFKFCKWMYEWNKRKIHKLINEHHSMSRKIT